MIINQDYFDGCRTVLTAECGSFFI